ncbi:radical SAM family heme chaperone HemW [Rhodocaloribacter litoris]|uniref:radical SAM family heme chaperone HemW n=1 Tax=Rhodocaloribacter litoris TaxID=2558931 RepID=UPI00141E8022|nr:radical SAM family heme chaperone HemW [Rhodocaloribacter litoris]QXD15928.1 radical SAM family heme chaperone HemW [Rhodocaloribacter litoris]
MAGIYLHIPFCTQRCSYCDFYFVTTQKSHTSFVEALRMELEHYALEYGRREPIETIYFGGGTPSLLHLDELARILDTIHTHYDTASVSEVTVEINPEDVDLDYLRGLRDLGVDRLSIGIQSFFDADLAFMNRCHDAARAEAVIPLARRAGFDNFSVDLIFGLPDQPPEYWAANLEKVVRYEVPHLSTYLLTVEERTPLFKQVERGLVKLPEDEDVADLYRFTIRYLQEHGYEHYEISSFARPGRRARHNQLYWTHQNYLGFGPSAHSFWWKGLPATRWANVRNLRRYEALVRQRYAPIDFREQLDLDTLANEYIMLRLRTADGLDLDHLEARYGVELLVEKVDELAWLERQGYIAPIRNSRVRLTELGKTLCDTVTEYLMIDPIKT